MSRFGIGFDVHPLVEGRPLVLGGITVPFERGLQGHSDGDVLTHAVIDALLGGAALGDIGTHFPSGDPTLAGIDSTVLLDRTVEAMRVSRWRPAFVDATILAERPALAPYAGQIKQRLARLLGLELDCVNIKATSTDGLGLVGREEGMGSLAVATVVRIE